MPGARCGSTQPDRPPPTSNPSPGSGRCDSARLNQLAEAAATVVPGVNLLVRDPERLSHRTREWFQRRGKQILAEPAPEWAGIIDVHRLGGLAAWRPGGLAAWRPGGLADADADLFLQRVPIPASAIHSAIVQGARGLPFYLHLQVSDYETLKCSGAGLTPDKCGGSYPEILKHFLDHLSQPERMMVRLASYPLGITEPGMNRLLEAFAAIHRFLFEQHDAIAQVVGAVAEVSPAAEQPLVHQAAHHRRWFDKAEYLPWLWARVPVFRDAARTNMLASCDEQHRHVRELRAYLAER